MTSLKKGSEYRILAHQKKTQRPSLFMSFIDNRCQNDINEEARDLYLKAGNTFMMENDFENAGECFIQAYDLSKILNHIYSQINALKSAALAYKTINYNKSIQCYFECINFYTQDGKFSDIIKCYQLIGEIYEENDCAEQALNTYQKCLNVSIISDFALCSILDKIANIYVLTNKYLQAIETFQQLVKSELKKHISKKYIIKILLCSCAIDHTDAQIRLSEFTNFNTCYERTFIDEIFVAIETQNVSQYENACFKYNNMWQMDKLDTHLLAIIKRNNFDEIDLC
jgi:alpha-soluble NSF attachment protein